MSLYSVKFFITLGVTTLRTTRKGNLLLGAVSEVRDCARPVDGYHGVRRETRRQKKPLDKSPSSSYHRKQMTRPTNTKTLTERYGRETWCAPGHNFQGYFNASIEAAVPPEEALD